MVLVSRYYYFMFRIERVSVRRPVAVCGVLHGLEVAVLAAVDGHGVHDVAHQISTWILCPFTALRQQVSALSSQMSRGSGLSKDGLGDLKRVVEAVEAAGMKNGTAAVSKTSAAGKFNQSVDRPYFFFVLLINQRHQVTVNIHT